MEPINIFERRLKMENNKLNFEYRLTSKGVFRWAFALGAGLTVGKCVGDLVGAAINGAFGGFAIKAAKSGNKVMQNACDNAGVKYKDEPEITK